MSKSAEISFLCDVCGFELWQPVAELSVSVLGLYNDDRFPGRCILVLKDHREHWEDLDSGLLGEFASDSQRAVKAITTATGSIRVNLAILGNTDPHLHFHLIPRNPNIEPNPKKSPWNDPRSPRYLETEALTLLREQIIKALG